jgi:hypothetical protein
MEKYLLVYYGGKIAATPAEQKKSMEIWMKWFKNLGNAVVDMGAPTTAGKEVSSSGEKKIPSINPITGYTILQTDNMDAALKMAKSSPQIADGGKIAVYSMLPM